MKEWRLFREMTVDQLAEAADMSTGNISAIENRRQGYSEEGLSKLAHALKTTPAAILNVNPLDPTSGDLWEIWAQADSHQRGQIADIARTIVKPVAAPGGKK